MAVRYLGAEVQRMEDPRLLTGHGRYVDDITMEGMLHAAFLRAPMAHAKIRSIDSSRAMALPGVHRVIAHGDLGAKYGHRMNQLYPAPVIEQDKTQYPLAKDEVCYVGEAVAFIVAALPALLIVLAVLSFLTLDSWLNRTFGG